MLHLALVSSTQPTTLNGALPSGTLATGDVLGNWNAASLAVVVIVWLTLGTRKKASRPLGWWPAVLLAALASTLCAAAGGVWSSPVDAIGQAAVAVQTASVLGNIGMDAIAAVLYLVLRHVNLGPRGAAVLAFALMYVSGRTGGLPSVPAAVLASLAHSLGG